MNSGTIKSQNIAVSANFSEITNSRLILGSSVGVSLSSQANLDNRGTINSKSYGEYGVSATSSTVNNYGSIEGIFEGVALKSNSQLINSGYIYGSADGVFLQSQGYISNSGTIQSAVYGISLTGDGYIKDSGLISGGQYAIITSGSLALHLSPGAVIQGGIIDNKADSQLYLDGGGRHNLSLSNGSSGFSLIDFGPNTSWTLSGTNIQMSNDVRIENFAYDDSIILNNFSASGFSFVSGSGLVLYSGSQNTTLDIVGASSLSKFMVTENSDETIINALCLLAGTKIRCKNTSVAVERLKIGDYVSTHEKEISRVKWVGYRKYTAPFKGDCFLLFPILIKRHALSKGVPSRDLYVSPGHGIFISGQLVPAWRLLNGKTITQNDDFQVIEYYHVELENHSIIYAENCPVETFFDDRFRSNFQNQNEYYKIYGRHPARSMKGIPRLEHGLLLETLQRRINARAGIEPIGKPITPIIGTIDEINQLRFRGWAIYPSNEEASVSLELFLNKKYFTTILANHFRPDLRIAGIGSGCHGFELDFPPHIKGDLAIRRPTDGLLIPLMQGPLAA